MHYADIRRGSSVSWGNGGRCRRAHDWGLSVRHKETFLASDVKRQRYARVGTHGRVSGRTRTRYWATQTTSLVVSNDVRDPSGSPWLFCLH